MKKKKEQSAALFEKKAHKKAVRKKVRTRIGIGLGTIIAAFFALLFLAPIVLTITNSFMTQSEISANYGSVFENTGDGGKVYISEKVNLKFIPDKVTLQQYFTVLLKSPEYLIKFWNSVFLAFYNATLCIVTHFFKYVKRFS